MSTIRTGGRHVRLLLVGVLGVLAPTLCPSPAPSQSVSFSATAGPAFSRFRSDGWEFRTGLTARGTLEVGFREDVSGLVQVGWSSKGGERPPQPSRRRYSPTPIPGIAFELEYLEAGLLGRYSPDLLRWDRASASVLAGPTLARMVGCRTRGSHAVDWGDAASPDELIDCRRIDTGFLDIGVVGEHMNDWDAGFSFGLQARIGSGRTRALVDLRLEHGLNSVDEVLTLANETISLTAGITWGPAGDAAGTEAH